jgi:regulator of sirC expression with transglutaminase-like and TPR domain
MTDPGKIYHRLKSNSISLKDAAALLEKCAPERKTKLIGLMREVMRDTERLLAELETPPQG